MGTPARKGRDNLFLTIKNDEIKLGNTGRVRAYEGGLRRRVRLQCMREAMLPTRYLACPKKGALNLFDTGVSERRV